RRGSGRRRLVFVRIGVERKRGAGPAREESVQHAGVADLVRDPDERRLSGEEARSAAYLRGAIIRGIPVEADTGRPVRRGIRELAAVELDGGTVLIAERQRIGGRVVEGGITKPWHIDTQAARDGQVRSRLPLVLDVAAGIPDIERLEWRSCLTRLQEVLHLEVEQRDRRNRAVRICQIAVRISVEVRQRVVRVRALDAKV